MDAWIIEELKRREEDDRHRRDRHSDQIVIDAPDSPYPRDRSEEECERGVVIIEL